MRTGTSHFESIAAAEAYYKAYGENAVSVCAKIGAGEIHIGPPACPPGHVVGLIRDEGRYYIETAA